jgi:hypothetical protein
MVYIEVGLMTTRGDLSGTPYEILRDYGLKEFTLQGGDFEATFRATEVNITLIEYGARKMVEDLKWAKRIDQQMNREEHLRSTNHALRKAWEHYQMVLTLVK